jgi:CO dehydrogenase maturation factor
MKNTTVIAYLGKGGSGKSILSSLTGKLSIESNKKTLLIDADPAMGLTTALEIEKIKTIGEAREEIIKQAKIVSKKEEKERLTEIIDYLLMEALYETESFSLLALGQTNTLGCYCPLNSLLRSTIETIASNFDTVIIDAEAGIEQVNRQVVESVHYPIIITDNSLRGVRTSIMVDETIKRIPNKSVKKTSVIFNRVEEPDSRLLKKIQEANIKFIGTVPKDKTIAERDIEGLSALHMPQNAISINSLREILSKASII